MGPIEMARENHSAHTSHTVHRQRGVHDEALKKDQEGHMKRACNGCELDLYEYDFVPELMRWTDRR